MLILQLLICRDWSYVLGIRVVRRIEFGGKERQESRMISSFMVLASEEVLMPFKKMLKLR